MQNIAEDFFLELFKSQNPISELPEPGSVETSEPAKEIDQARYNFLMSERERLLQIIRSSPITNQETGACYVACLELDEIHKELEAPF